MREIVLDTETTGLDPEDGHRIVEIGAVELVNHVATDRTFHEYLDPERDMPPDAFAVHGISAEFLAGKPRFAQVAPAFLDFIADAPLVIHNARFDMRFLNAELRRAGFDPLPRTRAIDTLEIARKKFPGAQNSLDALCRRFSVDNSGRDTHGALLDSELLAEVYLELVGGRQPGFALGLEGAAAAGAAARSWTPPPRPAPLPPRLTAEERAAHEAFVAELGENALWNRF